MFNVIVSDIKANMCFSDFVGYLNLLLNGSEDQKFRFMFELITNKKKNEFTH